MKKYLALIGFAAVIIAACNGNSDNKEKAAATDTITEDNSNTLALLNSSCFNCHNPDREATNRIAPGMDEIRELYLANNPEGIAFVSSIIEFVNNPVEENVHMHDAVKNYGMMPRLTYKDEELQEIAAYIYRNDLSSDEWYAEWKANRNKTAVISDDMSYEDMGLSIANGTKAQLGKNLMAALKQHGAPGAVTFCNTRAIPLTDSMSKVFHAEVKRVSDNPRNPANAANISERAYIDELKRAKANDELLEPRITEINGKMVGYYAIVTNKMCLQCHGDKDKDILPETLANIQKAYPNDKATGYGENQVRGIWVVTMDKK